MKGGVGVADNIKAAVFTSLDTRPCPLCGAHGQWEIGDSVYQLSPYDLATQHLSFGTGPYIATATCQECSHVLVFDAARLGIVETG